MKKFNLKLAATVMVCGAFLFSSCIGSFGLHSKLLSWNEGIGNKFVNELVYLAFNIIPVYGVCYLADALVINSIEFWSGSNPMASIGEVKKVKGENGNYLVETLENGYSITKEGETASMELIYDKDLNTWNVVADGVSTELLQINNDGTVVGNYSNEQQQVLGQIVLANFANNEGLASQGDNVWAATQSSGVALLGTAGEGNFGKLTNGALEASNVDLSKELVNMIVAQRNYQSNAQTIKTQDQILNTLVNLR